MLNPFWINLEHLQAKAAKGFLLCIFLFITSCQIFPTRFDQHNKGQWYAKLLVKDKSSAKSYILNVRFKAIYGEKLRMDFMTPIGGHMGSFLLSGKKVKYFLVRERKYFEGRASKKSLKPLLSASIDPKLVHNILFDRPINKKSWSCTKTKKGFIHECRKTSENVIIKWANRSLKKKSVYLDHPKAKIQMNFTMFSPHIEKSKESFQLKAPKGFKRFRLK